MMRVDLWDHEGATAFAQYRNFRLGNEKTAFRLHVGMYRGNAGNAVPTVPHFHFACQGCFFLPCKLKVNFVIDGLNFSLNDTYIFKEKLKV